jgi:DNA mismatch endonuclease, patch repair protein
MDVLTTAQRRRNMAAIRGKDTIPEKTVRSLVHSHGYRYVLHNRRLPGRPDLAFPRRRKVIFVHGCFWHMHACKYGRVVPKTNAEFWQNKRLRNVERDARNILDLTEHGWETTIVWECEVRDMRTLSRRLVAFLESGPVHNRQRTSPSSNRNFRSGSKREKDRMV